MPAPCQCGAEACDEPSEPHPHARRPPQCYHDDSDPVEPDNLPVPPAGVPKPTVRQTHHHQPVNSGEDTKFFDIDDHSKVDEDDDDETERGDE